MLDKLRVQKAMEQDHELASLALSSLTAATFLFGLICANESQENSTAVLRLGLHSPRRDWAVSAYPPGSALFADRSSHSFFRIRLGSSTVAKDPEPLPLDSNPMGPSPGNSS